MRRFCWERNRASSSLPGDGSPHRQILLQSRLTRLIEVDDADLVALAQHVEGLSLNVTAVQADQLGDPQTAVEKQR